MQRGKWGDNYRSRFLFPQNIFAMDPIRVRTAFRVSSFLILSALVIKTAQVAMDRSRSSRMEDAAVEEEPVVFQPPPPPPPPQDMPAGPLTWDNHPAVEHHPAVEEPPAPPPPPPPAAAPPPPPPPPPPPADNAPAPPPAAGAPAEEKPAEQIAAPAEPELTPPEEIPGPTPDPTLHQDAPPVPDDALDGFHTSE